MKNNKIISKYPLVQKLLVKTKFNYSILKKQSDKYNYFIEVTYPFFNNLIAYYISVPCGKNYLKLAEQQIKKLVDDGTLCKYTVKFISYEDFKKYATR